MNAAPSTSGNADGGVGSRRGIPRRLDFFLGITPLPRPLRIRDVRIEAVGAILELIGMIAILYNFMPACVVIRENHESEIATARFLVVVGLYILACGVSLVRMKRAGLYLLDLLIAAPLIDYIIATLRTPMEEGAFLANPALQSGPTGDVTYFLLGPPPLLPEVMLFCGIVGVYLLIFMPLVAYFTRRRRWFR